MQLMKKARRGILAAVAAAALALVPLTASAAEGQEVPSFDPDQVKIEKVIQASPEADVAGDTFSFTFTQLGIEDAEGGLLTNTDGDVPAIATVTSPAAIAMTGASDDTHTISDDKQTQTISFASIVWPDSFPHAGVYEYKVVEATPNAKYAASEEEYLMRVYVVNDEESSAAGARLKIDKVTMQTNDDDKTKVDEMEFVNRYDEKADLNIIKNVTGDYGDKTKKFKFAVTLTIPENALAAIEGRTVKGTVGTKEYTFTFAENETSATVENIELADGETLSFDDLPVGTRYALTETGEAGYTASATTYKDGAYTTATQTQPSAGTAGQSYTVAAGDNTAVTVDGASAKVANAYKEITPTGVLIDNLPYILMIGIPVVALIAWILVRSRNRRMYVA